MKRQPSEWEKIIVSEATDKELISKICKQLMKLNIRKLNNPIKKMDGGPKQTIFQEDTQIANNTQKGAQHHTLLEKCKSKLQWDKPHINHNGHHQKSTNSKYWRTCGDRGTLLYCWWECKTVQPLWKTGWRFFIKLKIELPHDPTILLLAIYPKKTIIWKDTYTSVFIVVLFTITRTVG